MAPFSKPETVLKQAEGLVSVGQSHAALQSLTEMFSSKRFRSTPLSSLEPIMLRFVELCVDMRKGRTAKEGLMQYKNIAQNTNVNSIEVVIQKFVNLADAKVREAQAKASAAAGSGLGDVDDLEATETPESILLGAVSGDQSKDRTDRALVTPWLKFLWESYRTALETLKNNARLEMIYQNIAQQAFKFCLTHSRKVEFRRLCETLRLHLSNTAKYSHQTHSINLQDPETLQHHLDTRFAQLNTSVELELWQEAFRSVEDVHNLLMMAKGKDKGLGVGGGLRPSMMAGYYEKLTRIFLMSGNALYHAAAWGRYYSIILSSSGQAAGGGVAGKSEEEMEKLAGQVLVSALAVPVGLLGEEGGEGGEAKGRGGRLTALLGLSKAPTRSGLLRDALSRNVLKLAPQPIKQLYNILEVSFDPLNLCTTITPLLKSLSSDPSYSSYLPLIQRAVLSRLLQQLSQVYETVEIKQLLDLVKPLLELGVKTVDGEEVKGVVGVAGVIKDEIQVEAYVMGCARRGELNVKIDHANGSITFVDDAFSSGSGVFAADNEPSTSTSGAARESAIQASTSELVRTRLSKIATALHNTLLTISPPPTPSPEEVQARLATLITAANSERKALQIRRALVARRRELLSELSARKEKEESSRKADAARKEKEEEARRQLQEVKKREMERTKKEIENIRVEEAKKLAESLKAKGRLTVDIDDMENLSTDNLMRLQVEQIEKEKRELNERLRIISKRVDHVERAFRKEERPLLAQDYESQQANDRATFDALQKARIEGAKITHEHNLETKQRLARMMEDYKARREVILAKRGEEFRKKQEKAQRKIAEEKAKRKAAVLKEREEERHRSEEEEKQRREEEEEKARKEAELRAEREREELEAERLREEEEAKKREAEEKAAAARKAREAERAEAAEKARLQLQREEEAAARLAARQAEKDRPPVRPSPPSSRPQTGEGGVWRRAPPAAASTPPTPTRVNSSQLNPPSRPESPAPAPAGGAAYRPGALAKTGGWRDRERAKATGGADTPPPGSPALRPTTLRDEPRPAALRDEPRTPPARADSKPTVEEDGGFQKVEPKKAVWRPTRGRGRGGL